MKTFKTKGGTELPMLDLRGKDYLQVAHRLVWFREENQKWGIETAVKVEGPACLATAWVKDQDGRTIAMAHKVEDKTGFPDFVEKAETGAIGRALALCGYGTQFAPDLDEGERLADSPLPRSSSTPLPTAQQYVAQGFNGNPGAHLVPYGKYKGLPISQLALGDIQNDIEYWTIRAKTDGKPLGATAQNYVDACRAFLDQKIGPAAVPGSKPATAHLADNPPVGEPPNYMTAHESDIPF